MFLDYWREYYRSLFLFFGALENSEKFSFWNDEHLARFYNYDFTEFLQKTLKKELIHSSLALSIFVRKGPGFMMHTDTNPPFDLTLDLCLDHANEFPRTSIH